MFTKPFKDLSRHDAGIAGGKGASLGEMTNAHIPVPDGFVVLSTTFDKFLEMAGIGLEIETILGKVNSDQVQEIEEASKQIQALVLNTELPQDIAQEISEEFKKLNAKYVAVRSSATAEDSASDAWAGQLDSFLNTDEKTLLSNVKRCFASLFTPRAIFYRFEKKLDEQKISVAVVIQKMVNSEVSGIAFSVHPVTEDHNQIIIEAGYGLGEAIVSGQITPDSYVVTKNDLNISDKNVCTQERGIYRNLEQGGNQWQDIPKETGEKACLSDKQIIELAKLIINIENHYGFPCDIEWAYESGQFYIVQSRPITTLQTKVNLKKAATLVKYFSRDHSLFYIYLWRASNCEKAIDWLGKNWREVLYVRPQGQEEVDVWYSDNEMDQYRRDIEDHIKSDSNWFPKIKNYFEERWDQIFQFIKNNPLTHDEFKKFTSLWLEWWEPMAIMMQAPEAPSLPKDSYKEAFSLRAKTQEYSDQADVIYRKYIKHVHPELAKYHSVLLPQEVLDDKFPDESVLKERLGGWFLTDDTFGLAPQLEDALREKNLVLQKETLDGSNSLSGQTAYRGIIKGVAKVVKKQSDLDKVLIGDILISPMTTPDFVPAMKKAAAFVTDEGGITCHAAIVARELKKPCLIGTKVATQVLRDGDEVEVDANSGVVRIISRKEEFSLDIEKFKETIKSREYITQQGNISIALLGNLCNAIRHQYVSRYGYKNIQPILTLQKGSRGLCYFDLEMYRDFSRVAYSRLKDSVDKLLEYQDYQALSKTIAQEYDSFSIPEGKVELKKKISDYFNLAKKYLTSTLFCEAFDHEIVKELAIKAKVKELDNFIETATLSTKPSFVSHQNRLLLAGEDISWSFANYFAAPSKDERLELLEKKRQEANREEIETEIEQTEKATKNNQELVTALIQSSSATQARLIEFVQAAINIRDDRKEFILKLYTIISDLLRALAESYQTSYDFISTLADNEINRLEEPGFLKVLEERFQKGAVMLSDSETTGVTTINYESALETLFNDLATSGELQGVCANKGKTRGRVRIILSDSDFHLFKEGEILVTGMTRAEYVPLMRKASAIITDEGGVTCHAAIVSRELGKPCIIGTKVATQILKDGDEVEVDANSGVVIILSRA